MVNDENHSGGCHKTVSGFHIAANPSIVQILPHLFELLYRGVIEARSLARGVPVRQEDCTVRSMASGWLRSGALEIWEVGCICGRGRLGWL